MKVQLKNFFNAKNQSFFLIALIIVYPLVGAFFGLDLGDTGYHMFAYDNFFEYPEKVNYTVFLSIVVGALWNKVFGGIGLLAFNLLEVLLEWLLVFIVYSTLKNVLGKRTVLLGSFIAVMAADTYLNIFNYHQFNAFLLTAIICLQYKAITDNKYKLSFAAGLTYMLLVFARVGSIVAIVTCFLYLYDVIMNEKEWKIFGKHVCSYAAGCVIMFLISVLILFVTGTNEFFVNNIFRLGGIATTSGNAYSFENLLYTLISDNLKAMATGFIFVAGIFISGTGITIAYKKTKTKMKKVCSVLLAIVIVVVTVYEMQFAYDINPAEPWPQMTTGPRVTIGIMYVIAFIYYISNAFKDSEMCRKRTIIAISGYLIVILTIAGSNTGTKHTVLGLWVMAPVFVAALKEIFFNEEFPNPIRQFGKYVGVQVDRKIMGKVFIIFAVMFSIKFLHMIYYTFNYDAVDRTKLTATVDSDKVAGIRTTQREADAINGVLDSVKKSEDDQPLMVFGASVLFYYMTEKDAYVAPWVTQGSYMLETYKADLLTAKEQYGDVLPTAIFCRTNYSYGFEEEKLGECYVIENQNGYSGKKDAFIEFLRENEYSLDYINEYYMVLTPGGNKDFSEIERLIRGQ